MGRRGDAACGFGDPVATTLEIGHAGSSLVFDFGDESDGTKRLFDFMDTLFTKRRDAVFVIDELDRSLHPMLTAQIVRLFTDAHADDRCLSSLGAGVPGRVACAVVPSLPRPSWIGLQ